MYSYEWHHRTEHPSHAPERRTSCRVPGACRARRGDASMDGVMGTERTPILASRERWDDPARAVEDGSANGITLGGETESGCWTPSTRKRVRPWALGALTVFFFIVGASATARGRRTQALTHQRFDRRSGARKVLFEVDVTCPPVKLMRRNRAFFKHRLKKVLVVTKCEGSRGWRWDFNALNPEVAHEMVPYEDHRWGTYHKQIEVDNRCGYGFVLQNTRGKRLYEIGGSNLDTALEKQECATRYRVDSTTYHNREVRDWPKNTSITWAWGRCDKYCPRSSKIFATVEAPRGESNVYRAEEEWATTAAWNFTSGRFTNLVAGYDELYGQLQAERRHAMYRNMSDAYTLWTQDRKFVRFGTDVGRHFDIGRSFMWFLDVNFNIWRARSIRDHQFEPTNQKGGSVMEEAGNWLWIFGANKIWACELPCKPQSFNIPLMKFPAGATLPPVSCDGGANHIFCASRELDIYRASSNLTDVAAVVANGTAPDYYPDPNHMWTRIHGLRANHLAQSKHFLWAIDPNKRLHYCKLPCDDGVWHQANIGNPQLDFIHVSASKFIDKDEDDF